MEVLGWWGGGGDWSSVRYRIKQNTPHCVSCAARRLLFLFCFLSSSFFLLSSCFTRIHLSHYSLIIVPPPPSYFSLSFVQDLAGMERSEPSSEGESPLPDTHSPDGEEGEDEDGVSSQPAITFNRHLPQHHQYLSVAPLSAPASASSMVSALAAASPSSSSSPSLAPALAPSAAAEAREAKREVQMSEEDRKRQALEQERVQLLRSSSAPPTEEKQQLTSDKEKKEAEGDIAIVPLVCLPSVVLFPGETLPLTERSPGIKYAISRALKGVILNPHTSLRDMRTPLSFFSCVPCVIL